ncbi:MAG: AAA family ATPase [Candidatus Firestonebacteria bacterium]
MIITIGNQKGGTGKTTISTNMAVLSSIKNKKTLLIDADIQRSSMDFRSLRKDNLNTLHAVQITKPTIHIDIKNFNNFNNIFIDAGGRDSETFRSAMLACDFLLVPVTPSPYDVWSSEETFKILKEARVYKKIQASIVLTQVVKNTNISQDVLKVIMDIAKEYNIKLCKTIIYSRVAYRESVSLGKGVYEYSQNSKASLEIQKLYKEVFLNGNTKET